MADIDDSATLAVVVARLDDLRTQQREDTQSLVARIDTLSKQLADSRGEMVARETWQTRNDHVDARFQQQGREIADLRTAHATDIASLRQQIDSRRMPWPSIAAAITGVAALVITLIQIIP